MVVQIASAAFYDDPVMAWAFPDPDRRLRLLGIVFSGLGSDMLGGRGIVHLAHNASVAMWRAGAPVVADGVAILGDGGGERVRLGLASRPTWAV